MGSIDSYISQFVRPYRNEPLYVAVSGGVDSIVLLHALHKHHAKILVLHMNYHLRGDESMEDQLFVQQLCSDLSISCEVKNMDLSSVASQGKSIQSLARKLRYQWFDDKTTTGGFVVFGHHQDDQIETFFINLVRRGGVMGLSAMLEIKDRHLRPLLNFSRSEILTYAVKNKLSWREDSSNNSFKYLRNIFRNKLIPEMKLINEQIELDSLYLIQVFQENQKIIENKVRPIADKIKISNEIPLIDWEALNDTEQIELMRQLSIPLNASHELQKLMDTQKGSYITIDERELFREVDHIKIVKKASELRFELMRNAVDALPSTFDKDVLYLDTSKTVGNLKLRKWQLGDRIKSVGLNGSQLVSDIITDAKTPASKRSNILVLHDDEHIHWVVGLKVGREAIATINSSIIEQFRVVLL